MRSKQTADFIASWLSDQKDSGWFTESFGTADLKEARALLEELARAGDYDVQKSGANGPSLAGPTIHGRGQE